MTKLEKARAATLRKRRWLANLPLERRNALNARRRERYAANPEPRLNESREYRQWMRDDRERRRKIAMDEA